MAAHGYDSSLPRNGTIFFYTVLAVFFLILTDLLLDSYFSKMMEAEIHEKVAIRGLEQVERMRHQEQLMREELHVDDAMKALAKAGRAGIPQIAPKSGQGAPEVEGWSQLKRDVAAPAVAPAEQTTPPVEGVTPVPAPGGGHTPAAPAPGQPPANQPATKSSTP